MCVCVAVSINIECIDTLGCRILSCGCKQILCVFLGCGGDKEAAASVRPSGGSLRFPACPSPLSCKLCTQFFFLYFPSNLLSPFPFPPHSHNMHLSPKSRYHVSEEKKTFFFCHFLFFLFFLPFAAFFLSRSDAVRMQIKLLPADWRNRGPLLRSEMKNAK